MGKALGGFKNHVVIRLKGRLPRRTPEGRCRYTSVVAAREEEGFLMMEDYIRRRQNTVAQYITTRSVLDLCEGSERDPGARVGMRWREEVGILEGSQEVAAANVEGDRGE